MKNKTGTTFSGKLTNYLVWNDGIGICIQNTSAEPTWGIKFAYMVYLNRAFD